MRNVAFQLITVDLDNGERGVFIGGPLVTDEDAQSARKVELIRFSDIQEVPGDVTVEQVLMMFAEQLNERPTRAN